MRAAPAVEIQAALRGAWWVGACGLWLAAALSLLGWVAWHWQVDGAAALTAQLPWLLAVLLGGLALLSGAGAAIWHARRHPARLNWDGEVWHCTLPGAPDEALEAGQVELMIDMGDAMLLRWQAGGEGELPGRTLWLPVARSSQPGAWHGLRVALQRPHGGMPA